MADKKWLYLPAKYQGVVRSGLLRQVVIHTMEAPEKSTTAESVARYFQTITRPASTHVNVDNDSIVQSVPAGRVAFAAPGANHDGFQIEIAGYARQSRAEWLDPYSDKVLGWTALATAEVIAFSRLFKVDIPVRHLTVAQEKDGESLGIAGHWDVTQAFRKSTHTDPGKEFPWDVFLGKVEWWLGFDLPVQFR